MDIHIHVSRNARIICYSSNNVLAGPSCHGDDQSSGTCSDKNGLSNRVGLSGILT